MYRQIILSKLIDYLKLKKVIMKKSGIIITFRCPFCNDIKADGSAMIIPNTHSINCLSCNPKTSIGRYYNLIDIARKIEKIEGTDEEVLFKLKELLNVKVITKTDEIQLEDYFKLYSQWGFDLVPITPNNKIPAELEWTKKSHKDVKEWLGWIKDGLNIGVKTGAISGITILDIDQKPIPEEIKKIMGNPIIQESSKGFHLIYKYESELRKTRIDDLKIDIENDGGQVVIYPSVIKDVGRKWIVTNQAIPQMPKELKDMLLSKISFPKQTLSEQLRIDIETEEFKINPEDFKLKNNNLEGCCNSSFIKLGGILRKQLNIQQTGYVLHTLNKHILEAPMDSKAINSMIRELDKYVDFDEKDLAHKVLEYLKDIEEASRNEIAMAVVGTNRGEEKKRIDKVLAYLVKEDYIIKKGNRYNIMQKVEWEEALLNIGIPVNFKVPYFSEVANFNWGDMLLIGSGNKKGKTHVAINIIKRLVDQGITPYYISLEPGSRFAKIAIQLGLKEGDFKHKFIADPTKIELEPKSVTVIDWLMIPDKAKTDMVFYHLSLQLEKTKGFMIVFQQLKEDGNYFAPNMCKQFPALACRYFYDNKDDGEYGKFHIDEIREPKIKTKTYEIPCQYNWETKEVKTIEEVQAENNPTGRDSNLGAKND